MNFLRELENFIIMRINKTSLLNRNLKQQIFTMNVHKQPPEVFCKKAVLKNFSTFTGKYLCSSLFLIRLSAFSSATLLKGDCKRFFVNIANFLKTLILKKICERLLLNNVKQNYSSMKTVK